MKSRFFRILPAMAAALLLAACSQDELAEQGPLPEGKCPLEIGSVTLAADVDGQPWGADMPQIRVSENSADRHSQGADGVLRPAQVQQYFTNKMVVDSIVRETSPFRR